MSKRGDQPVRVVGIGGSTLGSSTEAALRLALDAADRDGASTLLLGGALLERLPHYMTPGYKASTEADTLIAAVRGADGLIIASPGYHGSVSGMVKNAIDYLEETAKDDRTYLDGLPVGLIGAAAGWQAAVSTVATLRTIVHALRGWPTPMGAAINASGVFERGACTDDAVAAQLALVGRQVVEFARLRRRDRSLGDTSG